MLHQGAGRGVGLSVVLAGKGVEVPDAHVGCGGGRNTGTDGLMGECGATACASLDGVEI